MTSERAVPEGHGVEGHGVMDLNNDLHLDT